MELTAGSAPHYFINMEKKKNHIVYWRKQRGLTQEELAELAGAKRNTITLLEGGKRGGSFALISKIAKALGVTVEELESGPVASEKVDAAPVPVGNPKIEGSGALYSTTTLMRAELLSLTGAMDESQMSQLVGYAHGLRETEKKKNSNKPDSLNRFVDRRERDAAIDRRQNIRLFNPDEINKLSGTD